MRISIYGTMRYEHWRTIGHESAAGGMKILLQQAAVRLRRIPRKEF